MTDAVIVSTARTPLAKSWKGAFNMTHGATLGGHAVKAAVERAGVDPAAVEDVLMGCANPEGATGGNIARQIALRAGPAGHHRRASPSTASAPAACRRSRWRRSASIAGEGDVYVAGGVESISCVQQEMNTHMLSDPALAKSKPEIYWTMLQTAETGGQALRHLQASAWTSTAPAASRRRAPRQEAGKFNDEIAPITVTAGVADAVLGLRSKEVTVDKDEGLRAGTTLRRHQGHPPGACPAA